MLMKNLAIFDLDNTLILGDSDVEWPRFLMGKKLLDKAVYNEKNDYFFEQYKLGVMDIDEYLDFQLKPLSWFSREQLNSLHKEFMRDYILPVIPDGTRELVRFHQRQADELLVITATNRFIVTPIVAHFGIENLIAVDLEEDENGRYTGRYTGIPSYQEGKITRLSGWLKARQETMDDYKEVFFYSDSRNDLPLLNLVSHPVAVNPDDYLREYAQKNNWNILDFQLD